MSGSRTTLIIVSVQVPSCCLKFNEMHERLIDRLNLASCSACPSTEVHSRSKQRKKNYINYERVAKPVPVRNDAARTYICCVAIVNVSLSILPDSFS